MKFFFKYQTSLGRRINKRVHREWNRKSAAEKDAWLNEYTLMTQQDAERARVQPEWEQAWNDYNRVSRRRFMKGTDFGAVHRKATTAANELRQVFTDLGALYKAFHALEAAQPLPSNESLNWITNNDNVSIGLATAVNVSPIRMDTAGCQCNGLGPDLAAGTVGLLQPDGHTWLPWLRLSDGMAKGHLWLQFDNITQTVRDRVFRKDMEMVDHQWNYPSRWEGDIKNPDGKTPYEITCNDALQQLGLPYVVRLKEGVHRGLINNNVQQYKVYLHWCPNNDLGNLIEERRQAAVPIPEPMIWYVAEALAIAGCTMEEGKLPDPPATASLEWKQIVHRDIKLGNIFLDLPNTTFPGFYPDYPKPVLGDFGLAFKTSPNDPNNPRWYNAGSGTDGFRAPEQMRWIDQTTLEPMLDNWRVDSKTDIFAIGMLLRCLVLGRQEQEQPFFLGNGDTNTSLSLMADPMAAHYSIQLRFLIQNCLRFHPANRPTFRQLLERIRQCTDETTHNLARGMRSGLAPAATRTSQALPTQADVYAIHLARDGSDGLAPAAI